MVLSRKYIKFYIHCNIVDVQHVYVYRKWYFPEKKKTNKKKPTNKLVFDNKCKHCSKDQLLFVQQNLNND
jgi:hypothetical protein